MSTEPLRLTTTPPARWDPLYVLIGGTCGSGASTMLHVARRCGLPVLEEEKLTTRRARPHAACDITHVSVPRFLSEISSAPHFCYRFGGPHWYAIPQRALDAYAHRFGIVLVVVRSLAAMQRIQRTGRHCVTIMIHADQHLVPGRLKDAGFNDTAIAQRLGRDSAFWQELNAHQDFVFDYIIENNNSLSEFEQQVIRLLSELCPVRMPAILPRLTMV